MDERWRKSYLVGRAVAVDALLEFHCPLERDLDHRTALSSPPSLSAILSVGGPGTCSSITRPARPTAVDPANDDFLFDQGPTSGLGKIRFHDYAAVFGRFNLPNVKVFDELVEILKAMLLEVAPTESQTSDTDWLLAVGEFFTLVAYCQLVLENAEVYGIDNDRVDPILDVADGDFSRFADDLNGRSGIAERQSEFCLATVRRPSRDDERAARIWIDHAYAHRDAYEMADWVASPQSPVRFLSPRGSMWVDGDGRASRAFQSGPGHRVHLSCVHEQELQRRIDSRRATQRRS